MPAYLSSEYVWVTLVIQVTVAVLTSAGLLLLARRKGSKVSTFDMYVAILALAFIGIIAGYMTGLSRTPVVGAILPAILSVIGGLVLFIVTRDAAPGFRALTSAGTIALMLNLLIGSLWGSLSREDPNSLALSAANQELIRQSICLKRLAFEMEVRETRLKESLADDNPQTLVPGCSPPFDPTAFTPNDPGTNSAQ
jgi:hypothetical protein